MAAYVVWLDSREAKVFGLLPSGVEPHHVKAHGKKHHDQPHGKHQEAHHPEAEGVFKELSAILKDASQVLLLGPGESKTHFKTYLERHSAGTLAKKIVGVETVDHPSDNQILEHARAFFKKYDLMHD